MCCWHPFVSRVCWLVAGGALHWHCHLWILNIDASGVRWKTFEIKTFIKTAHKSKCKRIQYFFTILTRILLVSQPGRSHWEREQFHLSRDEPGLAHNNDNNKNNDNDNNKVGSSFLPLLESSSSLGQGALASSYLLWVKSFFEICFRLKHILREKLNSIFFKYFFTFFRDLYCTIGSDWFHDEDGFNKEELATMKKV